MFPTLSRLLHVASVLLGSFCGTCTANFTDWRLRQVSSLHALEGYGSNGSMPAICTLLVVSPCCLQCPDSHLCKFRATSALPEAIGSCSCIIWCVPPKAVNSIHEVMHTSCPPFDAGSAQQGFCAQQMVQQLGVNSGTNLPAARAG